MIRVLSYITAVFILSVGLTAPLVAAVNRPMINVYAYHLKPPYILDVKAQQGLYFDFVRYVNQKQQQYQFKLVYMPRKRIDRFLELDRLDGAVIGVSPVWFGDKSEQKYLWTGAILDDQDEVVSRNTDRVEYTGPKSLIGKRLGGVLGFSYVGIDPLVESGDIQIFHTVGDREVMELVARYRVDVGIVSSATLKYLSETVQRWNNVFYISPQPHYAFQRRLLLTQGNQQAFSVINPIILTMAEDQQWLEVMRKYSLSP